MNKRAEIHWEPQQTCQLFDSELWYLGDVSSCILVELRNLGSLSSMTDGDLNCKSNRGSRVIPENFKRQYCSKDQLPQLISGTSVP